MKNNKRNIITIGAVSVLTLMAACFVSLTVWVNTDATWRWIENRVNSSIVGHITIKGHTVSLAGRYVEVTGVSLSTAAGESVVKIDRVRAAIRILPLLKKRLRIKQVLVENIRSHLFIESNGRLNLVNECTPKHRVAGPEKTGGILDAVLMPRTVFVDTAQLKQLDVIYGTKENLFEAHVASLSLSGDADMLDPSGRAVLHGEKIQLNLPDIPLAIQTLNIEAVLPQGNLLRVAAQAQTDLGFVSVAGEVRQALSDPLMRIIVESTTDMGKAGALLGLGRDLSGQASLTATLSGTFLHPVTHADLIVQGAAIGPVGVEYIKGSLDITDQVAAFDVSAATSGTGELKGSGTVALADAFPKGFWGSERNLDSLAYTFIVAAKGLDVNTLLTGDRLAEGTVNAKLDVSGQGVSPDRLTASVIGEVGVDGFKNAALTAPIPIAVRVEGGCDNTTIQVRRISARAAQANITGSGEYDLHTREMSAAAKLTAAEVSPAAALLGNDAISGSLDLEATATGTFPDVRADASFKSRNFAYAPVRIGNVDGRAVLSQGTLAIQHLVVQQRNSRVQAAGTIRLQDKKTGRVAHNPSMDLIISQGNIDLEDFVKESWTGEVALSGAVAGTVLSPSGDFALHAKNLDIGIMRADTVDMTAVLEGDAIRVCSVDARFPGDERMQGSGRISLNRTYQFKIASDGAALHLLKPIEAYGRVDGMATFSLSGNGVWWDLPELYGAMAVDQLVIADRQMGDMTVNIGFDGHLARLSVENDVDINGTVNLADMAFSARSTANHIELAPYFALIDRPEIEGSITGTVEAPGTLTDIRTIAASATVEDLELVHRQRVSIHADPFGLDYQDGVVTVPDIRMTTTGGGTLTVGGYLGRDTSLLLDINGKVPAAAAGIIFEDIHDVTGTLSLHVAISGSLDKPGVNGRVELVDIGMALPVIAQRLHNINGAVLFDSGQVTIKDVQGGLGTGTFTLMGRASLGEHLPMSADIQLNARAIPVSVPDKMDVKLDANLNLIKTPDKSVVQGEVTLLDGLYYRDVQLAGYTDLIRAPFQKKRALPPPTAPPLPRAIGDISLDVLLKYRLPFKVDNNIALLDIQPDLSIKGTLNTPVLLGQAKVEAGEVIYQRKTFLVEKGVVSFTNPYKTEPYIDITGSTQIRRWRIYLKAAGTPDQLNVELTSDPQETQGDILSILLLGRPSRELNANGGAQKTPAQMMAELLASTFEQDIKAATGLDIVEIAPQEGADGEDTGQSRITVGSKLSNRLTLKHSMKSRQGEMAQETASDYQLTENMMISGFQDNQGVFGGKLVYRLEFR